MSKPSPRPNAPAWVQDRAALWNAVEAAETRKNSQVAREIRVALPAELDHGQRVELVREFCQREFVARGMVADIALHAPGREGDDRNHHAHILLTTREIGPEGFGAKNRDWNAVEMLEGWREAWARDSNRALERCGHEERIDHRTLEAQRIEAMERATAAHDRGDEAEALRQTVRAVELDRGAAAATVCRGVADEGTRHRGRGRPGVARGQGAGGRGRAGGRRFWPVRCGTGSGGRWIASGRRRRVWPMPALRIGMAGKGGQSAARLREAWEARQSRHPDAVAVPRSDPGAGICPPGLAATGGGAGDGAGDAGRAPRRLQEEPGGRGTPAGAGGRAPEGAERQQERLREREREARDYDRDGGLTH